VLADIDMKPMDGITLLKPYQDLRSELRADHHDGLCE